MAIGCHVEKFIENPTVSGKKIMRNSKDIITQSGISFGTSGARGLVIDFTPDVCAAFTHAFVAVLRQEFSTNQLALA
ncbi:hypothetical protein ACFX56_26765, partial [Aeromonas hydrophila]